MKFLNYDIDLIHKNALHKHITMHNKNNIQIHHYTGKTHKIKHVIMNRIIKTTT